MILQEVERLVTEHVRSWAKSQGADASGDVPFGPPPPHLAADLSLAWPLQAAKLLKKKPLDIAQSLAGALSGVTYIEPPQASAPGFVNFKFTNEALASNLTEILKRPAAYGSDPHARKRSILIEFVSANPTGPLHLASGRAATLGDSLTRILRRIGHKIGEEYYVNDAGRQVELLGLSIQARYLELKHKPSQFPEEGYQGDYIKDIAASAPPEAAGWKPEDFRQFGIERMLALHRKDMEDFGITFDRWFRESELHKSGEVMKALEFLKGRGMVVEKDQALWLNAFVSEKPEDRGKKLDLNSVPAEHVEELIKERVLVRKDGRPTYFLGDIAYHKDKLDRGWGELIDIWGADHHGYVPRMKAAIAALGKPPEAFYVIIHQLVHLYRGKELVKMSKRAGEFVTLKELLEEVGRDACRFFFAQRTPNAHMNFDLELAKKRSQENPVYYVQYVHARICSIYKEAAKAKLAPICAEEMKPQSLLLEKPQERALLVKMAWFPEVLTMCERELSPHPLANYLLELAGLFHPFYEECRVVDPANKDISQARLALCGGVRAVIVEGLELLGVSAPESM